MALRTADLGRLLVAIVIVGIFTSCGSDDPAGPEKDDDGSLPTASFTATPVSGPAPLTVQFTDTSSPGSSPITAWSWNFGDGASSTDQHPAHVYTDEGQFNVTLVVTTSVGSHSDTRTGYSNVLPAITEDDPSGRWSVDWTDVTRDCGPSPIADLLIATFVGMADPAENVWQIQMNGPDGLRVKQDPICMDVSANYVASQRRCAENLATPDLTVPVSILTEICDVIACPAQITEYADFLKEVRVTPTRRPDLTWSSDFESFAGTYTLGGDIVAVATIPILGDVEIPLGSCAVTFDLEGTRCDDCATNCP